MDEFVSRMDAQRRVIQVVNTRSWKEELYGLSSKAIQRWISVNQISPDAPVVSLIKSAAVELCFLANESQNAISHEYASSVRRITMVVESLRAETHKLSGA